MIAVLSQPSYFPDHAEADYYLFSKAKRLVRKFTSTEDSKMYAARAVKEVTENCRIVLTNGKIVRMLAKVCHNPRSLL